MSVLNSFSNWVFERKSSHEMRCGSSVFDVWNISNHELKGVCSAWGSSFCALLNNHYVDILSHSWLYWFRTEARIYLSNGQWPLHVKIFVQKYLNYCPAKIFAAIFKLSHTSHWPSKVVEQIFGMAGKSANSENFLSVLMMYETATIYISSW